MYTRVKQSSVTEHCIERDKQTDVSWSKVSDNMKQGNITCMKCRRARGEFVAVAIAVLSVCSSLAAPPCSGAMAFQWQCSPSSLLRSSSKPTSRRKRPVFLRAHDATPPAQGDTSRHIDLQSDAAKYGRGEEHITFDLQPGDVVVYQRGTWYVDGVAVGPGDDPCWSCALVDGLQVVWTHNCEHGVVRGWHLDLVHGDIGGENEDNGTSCKSGGTILQRNGEEEEVEFGPEQVIGRIHGIQWDDDMMIGIVPIPLHDDIWRRAAEEQY